MKKRIYATIMALLLSAAMLAGCGESSKEEDRSSRKKNEQSSEDKDNRNSSKRDQDKENSSSTAGDEQDRENTSDTSDDEQENPSNISEDDQKQEDTSSVAENKQDQTNLPAANSAEAYAEDIKVIITFFAMQDISDDDPEKMLSELQTMVNGMNVKTAEALVLKSDIQELIDILNSLVTVLNSMDDPDALADLDLNILTDAFVQIEELSQTIEDHAEAFITAAEASGIDEDTMKELEEMATSLGFV